MHVITLCERQNYFSHNVYAMFMGPTTTLFKKNIKNESHGTIYTFKNYFATVFSVFSFSNNKFSPNGPLESTTKKFKFFF